MDAEPKKLPQPVEDHNYAVNCFMGEVARQIEVVQAEREEAYRRAMEPPPREDETK